MIDSLGRDVGDIKNNVQAIKTQMLQDIGKSVKSNKEDNQEVLNKIATQLETIVGYRLDVELKKFTNFLDTIADGAKELTKNKNKSKQKVREMWSDPTARMALSLLKKIASNQVSVGGTAKPIPGQPRAVSAMNSTVNSMSKLFQNMGNFFKRNQGIIKGMGGGLTGKGGGGGKGGAKPVAAGGEDGRPSRKGKKETFLQKANRYGNVAGGAAGNLLTGGNPVETIISGLGGMLSKGLSAIPIVGGFLSGFLDSILKPLNEELESFRGMSRSVIVNYGTGIDDVNKKLEEFKITDDAILVTGQSRSVLLKEQQKYYKRGITDAKVLNKVMRAGLQTATLIDADASSTADMFADWSQHLGTSEHQLNMMGRGLVGIGRQTGLTGENLLRVAKSSEDFMKNMRLAGTFSGSAANNLMGVMAQAQKTGTTAGAGRLMGGLSSGLLGNSTDEKTKSLLMRAGTFGGVDPMKLISGTATDKSSMAGVANGLEQIIKQYTGGRDITKLSKQERGIISQIMEADTGFKLEELNLTMKNMREASKSFDQQLSEVEDKLQKNIYKPQEAQVLREGILFAKADETLEKFNGNLEQANPELKDALDKQVEIVNARSQRATGTGFSRIEGESNATLIERLQKANQEVTAAEQTAKDPYLKIQTDIFRVENEIRDFLFDLIKTWMPSIAGLVANVRDWILTDGKEIFSNFVKILGDIGGHVLGILNVLSPIKSNKEMLDKTNVAQQAILEDIRSGRNAPGSVTDASLAESKEGLANARRLFQEGTGYTPERYKSQQATGALDVGAWIKDLATDGSYSKGVETMYEQIQAKEQEIQTQEFLLWLSKKRASVSPDQLASFDEKVERFMGLRQQFSEAGVSDKLGLMPEMLKAQGEIAEMASKASKPGSIFTHDTHLEKLLEGMPALVTSMMPGMDVDEEIQKRQIAIDDSNAEIEANTNDTANNTRQTNVLLGTLLNVISRSAKRRGTDTPIAGEDVDDSVFFDQFIDVDWVDTIGRMVGNTWAQGNPGKHN